MWYLTKQSEDGEFAVLQLLVFILRHRVILLTYQQRFCLHVQMCYGGTKHPLWFFIIRLGINGWELKNIGLKGSSKKRPLLWFSFLLFLGNISQLILGDRHSLHHCCCLFFWSRAFILTPLVGLCFKHRIQKKINERHSVTSLTIFLLCSTLFFIDLEQCI